jgi:hypothetical protein
MRLDMTTADSVYKFLAASIEQLEYKEKEWLCELILKKPVKEEKQLKKKKDPVPTEAWYRKQLMKTWSKKKG